MGKCPLILIYAFGQDSLLPPHTLIISFNPDRELRKTFNRSSTVRTFRIFCDDISRICLQYNVFLVKSCQSIRSKQTSYIIHHIHHPRHQPSVSKNHVEVEVESHVEVTSRHVTSKNKRKKTET